MINLPVNSDTGYPILPNCWTFEGDRRLRLSASGQIEMFCSVMNSSTGMKDGPLLESQSINGR